jgi:UDP-2,4-diacetamido-2,4,6-trideoxy-beta-L-altropyranose hydrolase
VTPSVAFRVDASQKIGIGHVMRCLTLADALAAHGARTRFISRHLPRHLRDLVRGRGHECAVVAGASFSGRGELTHADWLEASQETDAADTLRALDDRRWDCLVVDHYALDARWETGMREAAARILVIDDLADRAHDCDVLLDQNVYPGMETRYAGKVPVRCEQLIGPRYALLRLEFRQWRERVAPRTGAVKRVMVCFGGVDAENLTEAALDALRSLGLNGSAVDVVIGASHPRIEATRAVCATAGYTCHVQSDRMAELMASADVALGAAGSTSWERCCVGLPTVCVATAHNQVAIAAGLESRGVAVTVAPESPVSAGHVAGVLGHLLADPERVASMSRTAWNLVDGLGAARVRDCVLNKS